VRALSWGGCHGRPAARRTRRRMPTPDLRMERCSQRVSPSPYPWAVGATQGDSCECRNGCAWRGCALASGTTRWLTGRGALRQSAVRGTWDARGVAVRSLCQVALPCGLCAENLPGLREPLPTARSCHLPPRLGRAPTRRPPDRAGAPPTPRSPEEAVRPAPRPPHPGPLQGPQAVHPGAGCAGVTGGVSQRCCRQGACPRC